MNKVEIERTINAPIDKVWNAWIEAKQLKAWHTPTGMDNKDATSEAREGGSYSISMVTPNGDHVVRGIYKKIEPMKKLVFTWKWDGEQMGGETTVTVEFRADGDKTNIKLSHEGFENEMMATEHNKGWIGVIGNLEKYLG